MPLVAVCGGAGAGKSSLIERVHDDLAQSTSLVLREIASSVTASLSIFSGVIVALVLYDVGSRDSFDEATSRMFATMSSSAASTG